MSKKKHKKMNHKHANHHKISKRPTAFSFSTLLPEVQQELMKFPNDFVELKLSSDGFEVIPGTEVSFPIEGNFFKVSLLQYGDDAADIAADFTACLFNKYATREFCISGDTVIIYAVDAPVDEVYLVWRTLMHVYNFEEDER